MSPLQTLDAPQVTPQSLDFPTVPDKAPTIRDVAAALGMHKSTVSLALSGKGNISVPTRARVMAVAQELGYEPNPLAQRLANGVKNNLVCLCSSGLDVGLTTQKILLIQKELGRRSLEVPIYTFSNYAEEGAAEQAAQIRHLCRQQPRAMVVAAQELSPIVFGELEAYRRDGGIVVSYDMPIPLNCDQVVFDREDNAFRAARHLIDHGHRRLGLGLSNVTRFPSGGVAINQGFRLKGFRRALAEAKIDIHSEWIFEHATYEIGGAEMATHFLNTRERPTGLCIVNDYVALAFMVEVMRAGIGIPHDLSVVGHDNQPVAAYCPVPLTSITQPVEQIAYTVVELLLDRLKGSNAPPRTVNIRGELVERRSVSAVSPDSL